MEYYKINIFCSCDEITKEGECIDTGNIWDEDIPKHFKTFEEAEQYVIDTFELKNFSYEDANEFDELQGGYEETEEGKKFYINQSITITKHIVTNCKFDKLKKR